MTGPLFAFVGRVSTEDNQEPEASRARQLAKARAIMPPGTEIVPSTSTSATAARCPGCAARRQGAS
jgi:hypothetical protein